MNAVPLQVGAALATLLFANVYAQSGESGAAGVVAPVIKGTPEQEAADKVARHDAATLAAREAVRGETGASVAWVKPASDQRDALAAERKYNAARLYANGEAHGGEAGR
jgi:hypothetical protein